MRNPGAVTITIYGVPADLVKEFVEKVVKRKYPRGISPAIVDLMRKSLEKKTVQETGSYES